MENEDNERCCGNCISFTNEDVYGVGWCSNNEHESSCDLVGDEHELETLNINMAKIYRHIKRGY